MKYYFQRPDANAETFKFGWFRSGDEGFYEEDARGRQFFFITGRIKELINRGGVKFSPFDIEEVLLEIPGVKVGLAVAFKNDYYGEEVGAYVVLQEGAALGADGDHRPLPRAHDLRESAQSGRLRDGDSRSHRPGNTSGSSCKIALANGSIRSFGSKKSKSSFTTEDTEEKQKRSDE